MQAQSPVLDPPPQQLNALLHLLHAGRMQELARDSLALLRSFPESPAATKLFGIALRYQGQLPQALQAFDRALQFAPDDFDAHLNRGIALHGLGQLEHAVDSYDRAIELKPDCADAYNNRGLALLALKQPEHALASCDQATRISPSSPMAHFNRGNALKDLLRFPDAAESYRQTCRLQPGHLQAHLNLGHVLKDMGEFAAASDRYHQALQLKPDYAEALFSLSVLNEFKAGDALLARMESLVAVPACSENDRMFLRYALAKAYEDLGEYAKSFDSLQAANHLHASKLGYRIDGDRRLMRHLQQLFSPRDLPVRSSRPDVGAVKRPIFILGMPRSGTSLVEQILASHPEVHGAGELGTLTRLVAPIMQARIGRDGNWKHDPVSPIEVDRVCEGYVHALNAMQVSEPVITDKAPLNFRWIGFILTAFPEARIVHVKRDAMAVCWSIYKQHFNDSNRYANRMTDLVEYYKLYVDLMSFWRTRFPHAIHELGYEDLTESQEEQTRKLLEYCGLHWEPRCLQFHETDRPVATASSMQVRRKMYRGSSQAWKHYEAHLQPMIDALAGYRA